MKPLAYEVTSSAAWFNYEKGLIKQEECHRQIYQTLGLAQDIVGEIIDATALRTVVPDVHALLNDLAEYHEFFAIANVSRSELHRFHIQYMLVSA